MISHALSQKIPPDIAAGEDIPKTDYIFMTTARRSAGPTFDKWNKHDQQYGETAWKGGNGGSKDAELRSGDYNLLLQKNDYWPQK